MKKLIAAALVGSLVIQPVLLSLARAKKEKKEAQADVPAEKAKELPESKRIKKMAETTQK